MLNLIRSSPKILTIPSPSWLPQNDSEQLVLKFEILLSLAASTLFNEAGDCSA